MLGNVWPTAVSLAMGHGLGRVDDALALMIEIENSAVSLTTRLLIQCHRAHLHAFFCQYAEAIELGMNAMQAVDDDRIFVRSLTSVASSLVMIGRTEDALSLTEAGLECALRVREELPRAPSWAVSSRCTALAFAGRVPEALELLDFAFSLSVHAPEQRALANGYRARFLLFEGRAASAARTLKEAALGMRTDPGYGSWCLALLAEAEALLGHSAAAEEARSEALSLHGNDRLSVFVDERRALAWVDAQAGRLTEADRRTVGGGGHGARAGPALLRTDHPRRSAAPGGSRRREPEHGTSRHLSRDYWERPSASTPRP